MTDSARKHTYRYDESDLPSVAVVRAVCEVRNLDAEALPALQDAVDTDALDTICERDSHRTDPVVVSFVYAGCSVTVASHGTVTVEHSGAGDNRGSDSSLGPLHR